MKFMVLIALTGFLFVARLAPVVFPSCQNAFDILSLHYTIKYFPFFAFGYICSMYRQYLNKFLENKHMVTATITSFAVLFYIMAMYLTPNKEGGTVIFLTEVVVEIVVGIFGLLIVFNVFRTYSQHFTSNRMAGRVLQGIGRKTLDIYLLHYFFLPYIPQLKGLVSDSNNSVLELLIGGAISMAVIWVCIIVSNVLRTSPILAKYLFGAKEKANG